MIRSVSDMRAPTTAIGSNEMVSAAGQPLGPQSAGSAIKQTGPNRWKGDMQLLGHKINENGNIKVVKDFDESLPMIPAHPAELNQVWTNLIDNAIHAMPEGGTLTVRTSRQDGWALVEICDTGVGVPPEMQQKIFEPFFTTKPVGQGTGLGLDISYRVITQRHGGDLRVVSRPGDTRFQVKLPLTEPPSFG